MNSLATSLVIAGLLSALPAQNTKEDGTAQKPRGKFTLGADTTYVTGPLDKDGYVDYAAALNERLGKGVTPADNAVVLIWMALGPQPEGATMPAEFFRLLGIPEPPAKGDYFIEQTAYFRDVLKLGPEKVNELIGEPVTRATQRPWKAPDYPEIAAWLKANAKPLAVIAEAARRPKYFSPLVPRKNSAGLGEGLIGGLMPAIQKSRALATALVARAMLRLGEGDAAGAWSDLQTCHRLGRHIGSGATLIEGLVGIAIDAVAGRGDLAFLDRAGLEAKRLASCLDDLTRLPPVPQAADKVALGERFVFLDCVEMVDRGGIRTLEALAGGNIEDDPRAQRVLEGIDWDPGLRRANRWYDRLADAMRLPDRSSREKQLDAIDAELVKAKAVLLNSGALGNALLGKPNAAERGKVMGDVLIGLLLPAVRKVQTATDRGQQQHDNVIVAFALARYQRDHGRYPAELSLLDPQYLKQVPSDLFAGKPLIYKPTESGYLFYSVGKNGQDDGGRSFDDDPPGDDLPVRMPLPELKGK